MPYRRLHTSPFSLFLSLSLSHPVSPLKIYHFQLPILLSPFLIYFFMHLYTQPISINLSLPRSSHTHTHSLSLSLLLCLSVFLSPYLSPCITPILPALIHSTYLYQSFPSSLSSLSFCLYFSPPLCY